MMQISPLINSNSTQYLPRPVAGSVQLLADSDQDDVLKFLEARPLQTVYLSGLIRDNGVSNPLNRGTFYGYRDSSGELEGVALIGHATLMETITDRALKAFAETAQRCTTAHLIMCEEARLDKFWGYYAAAGQEMRGACRQLLLELRWPVDVSNQPYKLRLATTNDLELLIPVHAEMARGESGVDPRDKDAAGFVERYARRIKHGRTWVMTENQKLIFKADVVTETPDNTYLEGVWVNPETRRQGYGLNCMSQLARMLFWRTKSLCLFVNDENEEAQSFYKQSGYHIRTVYDTIFMN
jgi:uncharacterized protein